MNKREFLHRLNDSLYKLPDYERVDAVNFYDEIISDKIEAGLSEDEAVASLGDVNRLRAYITAESVENSMRRKSSAVQDQVTIVMPPQKDGDSDRAGRRDYYSDDYGYSEDSRDQSRRDNRDRNKRDDKRDDKRDGKCDCGRRDHGGYADDVYRDTTADKKQWKGSDTNHKPKNPIKSFFTVFALCTSPVLVVLGIAMFVVLLSVLVSFAATAIGLYAGAAGLLVYGAATVYLIAQTYGIAAAVMSGCAYLFASALLVFFGTLILKIAAVISKSVVALFARLVKKNNSNIQPAKEGAK